MDFGVWAQSICHRTGESEQLFGSEYKSFLQLLGRKFSRGTARKLWQRPGHVVDTSPRMRKDEEVYETVLFDCKIASTSIVATLRSSSGSDIILVIKLFKMYEPCSTLVSPRARWTRHESAIASAAFVRWNDGTSNPGSEGEAADSFSDTRCKFKSLMGGIIIR